MDGSLRPIEGRPELIAYPQGAKSGPSVFPRTRWNKAHSEEPEERKRGSYKMFISGWMWKDGFVLEES